MAERDIKPVKGTVVKIWKGPDILLIILGFILALALTKTMMRNEEFRMIALPIIALIIFLTLLYTLIKHFKIVDKIKGRKFKIKQPDPDELLKWHDLKEKGVITEEEFEEHKKRILK